MLGILTYAIVSLHSHSQDSSETRRTLYGKWKVCIDTQFSKSYSCDNPFTSYTIFPNGQYEEGREVLSGGVRFQVTGKWTLNDTSLIMLDDARHGYSMSSPHNYNIQFINKNLFYLRSISTMEMSGQVFYLYFKRID